MPATATATIHVIATQHLDIAWLWPRQPHGEELMRLCFERALEMIEADPDGDHVHSRSTAWGFWIVQQRWPELFERVHAAVVAGRIEPCGGQWVEPDQAVPDGESVLRQGLLAQTWFTQTFGRRSSVAWNPDVFCHGSTLPQLFRLCGLDGYYFHRCRPQGADGRPLEQFVWEGEDGQRVLCFSGNWIKLPSSEDIDQAAARVAEAGLDAGYLVTGRHSDRRITLNVDWLAGLHAAGERSAHRVRWAGADDMLQAMRAQAERLPVLRGELGGYSFTGTYTTDGTTKRFNRKLEHQLGEAEVLAVAAACADAPYPYEELTACWRDLCLNQFHDIACGTCHASVQAEAHELYRSIEARGEALIERATRTIGAGLRTDAQPGEPVLIHNSLGHSRGGVVRIACRRPEQVSVIDAAGEAVPSQPAGDEADVLLVAARAVPALGQAVVYLQRDPGRTAPTPPAALTANPVLENDYVRCELDRLDGTVVSLVDKRSGREHLARGHRGNRMEYLYDHTTDPHGPDHSWEPWIIGRCEQRYSPVGAYTVSLLEDGPVRRVVRVVHRHSLHPAMPETELIQDIALAADDPVVHVHCHGRWHAKRCFLKAAFDLAGPATTVACDMPYGVAERSPVIPTGAAVGADAEGEDRIAGLSERFEPDRPLQQWLDIGDGEAGLAILNDGRYGYDSTPRRVRLSLLRAPTMREDEIAGLGPFEFSYGLLPHSGDWRAADLPARGRAFNRPLRASRAERHPGAAAASLVAVESGELLLTACKRAEADERLVLRCFQPSGRPTTGTLRPGIPVRALAVADALEEPIDEPEASAQLLDDGQIRVVLGPFEVKTLLLEPG